MMLRRKLSPFLNMLSLMIAPALLTIGLMLSLTSAYELPFSQTDIVVISCLTALILAMMFMIKKRRGLWLFILGVVVLLIGFVVRSQLKMGLYGLLSQLDIQFDTVMVDTLMPSLSYTSIQLVTGAGYLCISICFWLTLYFSFCCGLLKAPMLSYILALPLAVLAVFYVNSPPDSSHLLLLIIAILLVPMQQLSCQSNSSKIAAINSLLVLLVAGFVLIMQPIAKSIDGSWLKTDVFESIFTVVSNSKSPNGLAMSKPESKPLSNAGTEDTTDDVVMTINSSDSGVIYLRGYSLSTYTGDSWEQPDEEFPSEVDAQPYLFASRAVQNAFSGVFTQSLTVNYSYPSSLVLVPYFCVPNGSNVRIFEGNVSMSSSVSSYVMDYTPTSRVLVDRLTLPDYLIDAELDYRSYVYENYTAQLPQFVSFAKNEIGISDVSNREEVIWQIASYLSSHCSYSRTVDATPSGENVAMYFLNESRRGNCVHFSTSAAVILQSLGIPARYVGGYRVSVNRANTDVDVTENEAHAWIEVYFDGVGWLPFEMTYSSSSSIMRTPRPIATPTPDIAAPVDTPPPSLPQKNTPAPSQISTPSSTISPSNTDVPSSSDDSKKNEQANIPAVLWVIIGLCALVLLTVLRRILIKSLRYKRWDKLNNNRYAISVFKYSRRLEAMGVPMPEDVDRLAKKARFSQHSLTNEERRLVERSITQQCSGIKSLSKGKQFLLAYVLAIY